MKQIAVIIPTYNERKSIADLIDRIFSATKKEARARYTILVVDANSPDGTGEAVRKISQTHAHVHLITEREKSGIGSAYVTGFTHALNIMKADAVIEFDGDGQHNPDDIPRLTEEYLRGADYVIGSRYVDGGGIPKEWAWHRKVLSNLGGKIASFILEMPIKDTTSGLKLTRLFPFASLLPLSQEKLLSQDYAYKIQFLHVMHRAHARIVEVPIQFLIREHDESKSTWKDIVHSLRVVLRLRLRHWDEWQLLQVLTVGLIGFVLQSILFYLFVFVWNILAPYLAGLVSGELAVLSNFYLNNRYTFIKHTHRKSITKRLFEFHCVSAGSLMIQTFALAVGPYLLGNSPIIIWGSYIMGIAIGTLSNYLGYKLWVWR